MHEISDLGKGTEELLKKISSFTAEKTHLEDKFKQHLEAGMIGDNAISSKMLPRSSLLIIKVDDCPLLPWMTSFEPPSVHTVPLPLYPLETCQTCHPACYPQASQRRYHHSRVPPARFG
ncbi:hypothetical protein C0Q70_00286 [Pomacea canaliculata]|uniref:Uncharacterized protein n=1 Tax=Pomacea canaliculata TaxID=400727 RepID=A0A2T7PW81_POMCA|nr:hypothetical protein C0Q70_00286 [Pomacea canaliculata]